MSAGDNSRELGPDEITVEASPQSVTPGPPPLIHLVQDHTPCLTGETELMLRSRLRAASIMMFAGFASFLAWSLVEIIFHLEAWLAPTRPMLAAHVIVTAFMAVCASTLCRTCPIGLRWLRLKELLIFGIPALYFLFWEYQVMVTRAGEHGVLPNVGSVWLMLIFTYALFIPNTWRRAAVLIGSMALAPNVLITSLVLYHPLVGAAKNASLNFAIEHLILTLFAGVSAVVGVHIIGRLRREAYEARRLGHYRLRQRLGGGGMGEVYLAEHQLLKRPCAIKLIQPERAGDPKALARFEREVRATAKLSHWNSIDIYDYGRTEDGTFYYVMEYLPGRNVAELVRRHGPLPAERVIYLLRQICDALTEAHTMGLIHRDIKPANIFSSHRGGYHDVAKLLDFGLVKPISEDADETQLTQDGAITGSPAYMSPEQAMGDEQCDARTDIYSLGAVAYYMLTGRPPFEDEKPLRLLFLHASATPAPLSQYNPTVPEDLEQVVLRCLAKSPGERYQSAALLGQALDECRDAGRWSSQLAARWWQGEPILLEPLELEPLAG